MNLTRPAARTGTPGLPTPTPGTGINTRDLAIARSQARAAADAAWLAAHTPWALVRAAVAWASMVPAVYAATQVVWG